MSQQQTELAPLPDTFPTGAQIGDQIHLRLLVIAAIRSDPNLAAISLLLDQIGIPYDILIATETALTAACLGEDSREDSGEGNGKDNVAAYQGIILTTGNLLYWNATDECWQSAFDETTWQLLWRYEKRFGIRQLILYAIGGAPETYGLQTGGLLNTTEVALPVAFTEAGRQLFAYLNHANGVTIEGVPVYLAQPTDDATVPLLVTSAGQTVAALHRAPDGREILVLTVAHGPTQVHTLLLGYGLINWVTRGLFLGERRVYLSIQVDDIFNRNLLWDPKTAAPGECIYRLTACDAKAVIHWLDKVQQQTANASQITLDFAFNSAGILGDVTHDPLAASLLEHQTRFRWINHGYTHLHLDHATYAESRTEILANHAAAVAMNLVNYEPANMVTAVVSGLENADFLDAALDAGIRYLVSDTSRVGWNNPAPNRGIVNPTQPAIFCIPRRPTNLFYDVSTPDEWISKYNQTYRSYWGRDLSMAEFVEEEVEMILHYLLTWDLDPLMFHQANLRAYDGTHTLLSHLFDSVLERYNSLYGNVPIVCLAMHEIGARMSARAAYHAAQLEATWIVGEGLALLADQDIFLPITGIELAGKSEWYAGQPTTHIALQANVHHWIPYSMTANKLTNQTANWEN